jgi:ADP-ribose pyrophosphatase
MAAEAVWTGKFLEMRLDGRWEYAARTRQISAAVILAVTDADEVVLVEQPRAALGCRCLELPAGLVGDEAAGEASHLAAERELHEETGFEAAHWEALGEYASSPGLTSETFHLFRATGLTRTGPGGGDGTEDITVHLVPRADLMAWLKSKRAHGLAVDAKVLYALMSA